MKDILLKLHPVSFLLFFISVIGFTFSVTNPICTAISFICSLTTALVLNGSKAVKLTLVFVLPMLLFIAVINPVFSHQGVTILTYLPDGNPLTLESIIYGIYGGFMLSSVVLWFSCFSRVMTSDKLIYLFGKVLPSLGLLLSMTLRFVPRFTSQLKVVRNAQKCIGRDISDGSVSARIKNAIKIISIMISWSMENAIETADSMKSRGHGLKGRTSYSNYKFRAYDYTLLLVTFITSSALITFICTSKLDFYIYPLISGNLSDIFAISSYMLLFTLMMIPLFLSVKEELKWKFLKSKI